MPTAQRAPAALLVRRGGDKLLVDCAEGTQRQLLRSSVGLLELEEVFITHFHADHVLGLPGMLKTFALRGREVPLTVYGPRGLVDLLLGWSLIEATRPGRFDVARADALGVPNGPERGALQRGEDVTLAGGKTVTPDEVLGPPRPGRKLVITGDTAPSEEIVEAAWEADVLVTEATFSEEERDRAEETKHQTATQAAEIARRANVAMLALTHLSNRYFGPEIAREAREIFPETVVPRDFDVIEIAYAERGGPQLIEGGASHRREQEVVSSAAE